MLSPRRSGAHLRARAGVVALVLAAGWPVGGRAQAATPRLQASNSTAIQVGPNTRVSTDGRRQHAEVHLAADPQDPNRLAACSIIEARPGGGILGGAKGHTVLYVSHDGGATWARAVEDSALVATERGPRKASSWDPTCEYGRAGALYFATGTWVDTGLAGLRVRLHRSPDAGRTWLAATEIASGFIDKPWLVTDTWPESPFVDRLYLAYLAHDTARGNIARRQVDLLLSSTDVGASFTPPVADTTFTSGGADGAVVLSNGTLVVLTGPTLAVLVSADGGQTITASQIAGGTAFSSGTVPRIAADPSNGPFRDRVYVAWSGERNGRNQIFVAHSADKGRTWSPPCVVNDDRKRLPANTGPDDVMPTVAVNRDGVVGVSWYDRRDHPDNLGYYVRFSASLDGGDTWLPSVRVSERPHVTPKPMDARTPIGLVALSPTRDTATSTLVVTMNRSTWITSGHFAGLAATADGVFHALWVDNRTGVSQVWTAPIRVRRRAARDPAFAGLRVITNRVAVAFDAVTYQRTGPTTGIVGGAVTVTNTSVDTVRGPLRLQVQQLALANRDAAARVTLDAEHRNWRSAQAWDLSGGLSDGVLPPGATSAPVPIRFRLEDLAVAPQPDFRELELTGAPRLELRLRVLAGEKRSP